MFKASDANNFSFVFFNFKKHLAMHDNYIDFQYVEIGVKKS